MNKLIATIIGLLLTINLSAQIVYLNEDATKVSVVEGKVVFLKEIPAPEGNTREANYKLLKDWAIKNYGKDPFISSVRVDPRAKEIIAKSRIELVLPEGSNNEREKFVMRYRVNGYILDNRCVLEVTDISFLYQGVKEQRSKSMPKVIRAELFITDDAIRKEDELKEIRDNTRKSTLYFINRLNKDFERAFGYMTKF